MSVKSYRNLQVWQKSMDFMENIYGITKDFPKEEIYGITSQIRRAVLSVPANIAEGSSKKSRKEFIRFINISYGSLAEAETFIIAATRLNFLNTTSETKLLEQAAEIGRMLNGLRRSLSEKTDRKSVV